MKIIMERNRDDQLEVAHTVLTSPKDVDRLLTDIINSAGLVWPTYYPDIPFHFPVKIEVKK